MVGTSQQSARLEVHRRRRHGAADGRPTGCRWIFRYRLGPCAGAACRRRACWSERRRTAAAVARATEVVFLCLTDAAAVEMVISGPDSVSSVPAPGKLVVDFSSIPPDSACSIAARLNAMNGMSWIDAPVSGGPPGAANGTLAVMAGGEATDIERVKPYVLVMAQRVTHMGPIGAGQTTKLCNQIIAACRPDGCSRGGRRVSRWMPASTLHDCQRRSPAASRTRFPLQMLRPRMANAPGSARDRRRLDHPQGPRHDRRCRARARDASADGKPRGANVPAAECHASGPKIDVLEIYGLADPQPKVTIDGSESGPACSQ